MEALLLERPVITTNVPGCNRIIKNNFNGILCDSKNNLALKNAIDKFINLQKLKGKKWVLMVENLLKMNLMKKSYRFLFKNYKYKIFNLLK